MKHNTFRTLYPTCPHCGHEMSVDEMNFGAPVAVTDLWAIAPNEESTTIQCPVCDEMYWVQGGYKPEYTSAFSEEELQ